MEEGKQTPSSGYSDGEEVNLSGKQLQLVPPGVVAQSASTLNISRNLIENILKLSEIPRNLKKLDLSYNLVAFLPKVSGFDCLKSLDLSNNRLTILENLDSFPCLSQLNVGFNSISSIAISSSVISVESLNICHNPVEYLNFLWSFPSLTELNLSNCFLSSFSGLSGLKSLRSLDLSNNRIVDDRPIELPSIKDVNLSNNRITSLSFAIRLRTLTSLNLSGNPLCGYDSDEHFSLQGLKDLDISGTMVRDFSFISVLAPNLTNIRATNIDILDSDRFVSAILGIKQLQSLEINQILPNYDEIIEIFKKSAHERALCVNKSPLMAKRTSIHPPSTEPSRKISNHHPACNSFSVSTENEIQSSIRKIHTENCHLCEEQGISEPEEIAYSDCRAELGRILRSEMRRNIELKKMAAAKSATTSSDNTNRKKSSSKSFSESLSNSFSPYPPTHRWEYLQDQIISFLRFPSSSASILSSEYKIVCEWINLKSLKPIKIVNLIKAYSDPKRRVSEMLTPWHQLYFAIESDPLSILEGSNGQILVADHTGFMAASADSKLVHSVLVYAYDSGLMEVEKAKFETKGQLLDFLAAKHSKCDSVLCNLNGMHAILVGDSKRLIPVYVIQFS